MLAGNLEAYIAGDRRRALAAGHAMPDRVSGSAIFADISGFSQLTEALVAELGEHRGAEELTATLNRVFDAVLGRFHRYGGSIVYFSGDAVTGWMDGDDGELGVACALEMQRAMEEVADLATPGGTSLGLGMKVAVVAGEARRFVVGDPKVQLIDVLAGALVDRLAGAEQLAAKGEVVVDVTTLACLNDRVRVRELRTGGPDQIGVVGELASSQPKLPVPLPYPKLPRSVVRHWLLPAVYERVRSGSGEFLAELRPAVPIFVRFRGIDYDGDPEARLKLDGFVRQAEHVVDGYGGNVLQLTLGDKGAYLYGVFGSPLAHEDDAARACAAALELLGLEGRTAATQLQVGLARGRLRSGSCGNWQRRTFCCLGDATNLAARLMSAAPAGQVYLPAELAEEAGTGFDFEVLPYLTVKGKTDPVAIRRLVGRRGVAFAWRRRSAHPLVGRGNELRALIEAAEQAESGRGGVVSVVAEPGMGKSRLVGELVAWAGAKGLAVYVGAASAIGGTTSYLAWHEIWRTLFGVPDDSDPLPALERALSAAGPDLLPRLPLLGAVLGVAIADNELTASFDPKLRKLSLESLLTHYLALRARMEPIFLVLEDCHWLDPLSADLLEAVARAAGDLALLVVLTYRPKSFTPRLPHATVIELASLSGESARQLLTERLAELYGPGRPVAETLVARILERAAGNPFYLEELVKYLHLGGTDLGEKTDASVLELPVSLTTLVLSRIDTLPERPRRALKLASVVGQDFSLRALLGAYPRLGNARQLQASVARLRKEELVTEEATGTYSFKHAIIRDVAYESLPFSLRRELHGGVGSWLETVEPGELDLLAYHFWYSGDETKKLAYLLKAGDAARASYANVAAADYFRRAVPLLADDNDRHVLLLKLGAVLELRGDFVGAEAACAEALELAERYGDHLGVARARTAKAGPIRKQGDLERALLELELARPVLEAAGEIAGLGQVAHLCGTIAAQRGDYTEARAQYERSLGIRRALGDQAAEASILSNLAIVAEYEEDYDRAQQLNEEALALRTDLGDRWGIGVSKNNLGMIAFLRGDFAGSRDHLEEALEAELQVGDLWMVAIARHNLGNAMRELGEAEAARHYYKDALSVYGSAGDKWAQCLLLEDVALLSIADRPLEAARLLGAAEAVREMIGSPRVATLQAQIDKRFGALADRHAEEVRKEKEAGRQLALEEAQAFALGLCQTA